MDYHEDDTAEDAPGFFKRAKLGPILTGVVLVGGGLWFYQSMSKQGGDTTRREAPMAMVRVSLPPPPPPPVAPPPPPPPQQQEQKMEEQAPVDSQEAKPEEPKEAAPAAIGTNNVGNGPADGFGLGRNTGNNTIGGRGTGAGNSSSKWGWYAGQVQTAIGQALRSHRKTRSALLNLQVKIWPDANGRISRAQLVGSSGDAATDAAIKDEVLAGLQLQEPPPAGMQLPIVMRLNARRPN